ncbi:kinase-like domain-containing protein [Infundibulicybe gibba]|nr:kinase-like domain-containing protein [Infundibulicybe gibba]
MSQSPSLSLISMSALISQGAEAKVYKATLYSGSPPILLKHRFQKKYRHRSLDFSLTRSRIAGEARALQKCLRSGVNVPGVRMVDLAEGVLGMEWIDGKSVRRLLPGGADDEGEENPLEEESQLEIVNDYGITIERAMDLIGVELAKMHLADVIHGDLTTSNMMIRRNPHSSDTQLVLIDFGLSYHSNMVEDKAVDLYVLERAFSSTHPASEALFASVLASYSRTIGKEWLTVGKRLEDVRLRGRKRSMVG